MYIYYLDVSALHGGVPRVDQEQPRVAARLPDSHRFVFQGSGFRVQSPGFRVQGPGSRFHGPGLRVEG